MNRHLLDSNHLSAYLDGRETILKKVDRALRAGDRFGICLPVLCEYRAGIRVGKRYKSNLHRLQEALRVFRIWTADGETAAKYGELFRELRAACHTVSQFDLLIAAVAQEHRLTILTADKDCEVIPRLRLKNWL